MKGWLFFLIFLYSIFPNFKNQKDYITVATNLRCQNQEIQSLTIVYSTLKLSTGKLRNWKKKKTEETARKKIIKETVSRSVLKNCQSEEKATF